ncbi:MAG: glycosyltransferase family 9 protein, partial [Alphaproteobacteria bacterium]
MRILFITSNRIGDAVLSTGGLAWMLDAFPMARVTVACGPAAAGLFEAVPRLETLLVMRKRPYSLHWLDLWRRVAFTRWRAVADLRGSATAYLVPTCRRFVLAAARPDRHKVRQVQTSFRLSEPPAPRLWS